MFVEQKTLARQRKNMRRMNRRAPQQMDGWGSFVHSVTGVFRGNPLKRGFTNIFKKPLTQVTKLGVKSVLLPTAIGLKALSKVMPMPQGPVDVPVDSPAGPLMVSADPYVNQMGPTYQTYPAGMQSDYFPPSQLPLEAGTYLSPDMTQVFPGDPNAPAKPASVDKGKVLLYGGIAAAAAWFLMKQR